MFLDRLAVTYKRAFKITLEPKPGAVSLVKCLMSIGKKIMIITEGPQDALDWTVEKLGFAADAILTTNTFGVSKVDGLFGKVLEKFCVRPCDMIYVGDSWERDVIPVRKEGMLAVHYDEKASVCLGLESVKVNSLFKLEHILRSGDAQ